MKVLVQRVYEYQPVTSGTAILVDRLWPRGASKASLKNVVWLKELAPSNELRQWFHTDKETRYKTFASKYNQELEANQTVLHDLVQLHKKPLTLLTAVKDIDQSHIPTLEHFLKEFDLYPRLFTSLGYN